MSNINVETAYLECWVDCPMFEIIDDKVFRDNQIYFHVFKCRYMNACEHVLDVYREVENG